jgi:hypothetical protein
MCFEIKTTMACGHHIISTVCDPKKVHNQSCEGQRQRFIYDTCAGCDPEHARTVLKQHYEQSHSQLMALYLQAKVEGDTEWMKAIEQLMIMAAQDMRRENFNLSLTRRHGLVVWPKTQE